MTNGRDKGKKAERDVAKLMEAWWGKIEPGCRFVPTPMSGGWSSPAVRGEFRAAGDLVTTAQKCSLVVEVKRREGWAWDTFLQGKPSPIWGWWKQAGGQAVEINAAQKTNQYRSILFFRHNREPWWVMLHLDDRIEPFRIFEGSTMILPADDFFATPPEWYLLRPERRRDEKSNGEKVRGAPAAERAAEKRNGRRSRR